jgi:hypothetical protein
MLPPVTGSSGRGRPGYRADGILLRMLAATGDSNMLAVRIDLDPMG